MNERKDQKINRRDFIQVVSKAALPTIAFLSLGRPGNSAAKSHDHTQELDKGLSQEPNDCKNGCEDTCKGSCTEKCANSCSEKCANNCADTCGGGCKTTCEGACKGTCEDTCKGTCKDACGDSCKGGSR